ncbi:MAG: urea ABC transporter substrate-binding protein [Opitutaceae bacterium]|jgi:urea transport system substrate-binding protein|nr:urea ABC transporter substrate-binding protein [Opitutaceae bacterium]
MTAKMNRMPGSRALALAATATVVAATAATLATAPLAQAQDTVKVGVLHSLSGTMAISETSLRDVLLYTFDEINAAGGVLGKKIEPVVVDGASNWPLFAEKATQLLEQDKVAVTFGCWTSVSRKSVLPVYEKNNGLLFYPVQYEGEELSKNIFYTAEAVNQQATPGVDYLLGELGKKKFYLLGSDYVYPRTTNLVLKEYLASKGIPESAIIEKYTPFGHTDYQQIVSEIKQFAASGDACVVSTLNGDTNVPFFRELANAGIDSADCPVMSFSVSEDEFRGLPTRDLVGHLGAWSYFMSLDTPANAEFKKKFFAWLEKSTIPGIEKKGRVTNSPMVLSHDGVYLWKAAVEKAGSFDVDKVREVLESGDIAFDGPGGKATVQKNHHVTKNVYVGETLPDGQFKILKSYEQVYGEPFLKGKFK